jgi:hypothetical protein
VVINGDQVFTDSILCTTSHWLVLKSEILCQNLRLIFGMSTAKVRKHWVRSVETISTNFKVALLTPRSMLYWSLVSYSWNILCNEVLLRFSRCLILNFNVIVNHILHSQVLKLNVSMFFWVLNRMLFKRWGRLLTRNSIRIENWGD